MNIEGQGVYKVTTIFKCTLVASLCYLNFLISVPFIVREVFNGHGTYIVW